MSLAAFKNIYWWEWTHRLVARTIGIVFLLPLLWFWWQGWISPGLRNRLWLIFGLGALQGAVGWWMVASGLADRVEVSQYRLATHLVLACLIYVALLWTAQRWDKQPSAQIGEPVPARMRFGAIALLVLVLVQIYLGAIVAGLRAGHIYNTWPLIDGALVPDSARLFFNTPLWRNFFENTLTAQFDHRTLAYAIWIVALLARVRRGARGEERPGGRRRRLARGRRDVAGGARHLDAVDGRAAVAFAAASGHGDGRADDCDAARGVCCGRRAASAIVACGRSGHS